MTQTPLRVKIRKKLLLLKMIQLERKKEDV